MAAMSARAAGVWRAAPRRAAVIRSINQPLTQQLIESHRTHRNRSSKRHRLARVPCSKEAERIGLVSVSVPRAQLMDKAMEVANKLAMGSQQAIRLTKRSLNGWMNMARPVFESSLAMEMLCFMGEDAKEGVAAVKEKRAPVFPSTKV